MTFGQPDEEGWFYALTFDRLAESLKQKRGIGQSSKMLVRRRRHVSELCRQSMLLGYFRSLIIIDLVVAVVVQYVALLSYVLYTAPSMK